MNQHLRIIGERFLAIPEKRFASSHCCFTLIGECEQQLGTPSGRMRFRAIQCSAARSYSPKQKDSPRRMASPVALRVGGQIRFRRTPLPPCAGGIVRLGQARHYLRATRVGVQSMVIGIDRKLRFACETGRISIKEPE